MKKILLSLFWFITLWLLNFSSAEIYDFTTYDQQLLISSSSDIYLYNEFYNSPVICFDTMSPGWAGAVSFNWNTYSLVWQFISCYMFLNNIPYHLDVWGWSIRVKMYFDSSTIDNDFSSSCDYSQYEAQINTLSWNLATCQSNYDTLNFNCNNLDSSYKSCLSNLSTCQSDFNSCQNSSACDYSWYILESEINSWYCLVNWLCPSSEICNDSDYSNLFIYSNNKYFSITWTNNIYVNLPSYLWYDYDYSNAWNDLDIDVWMVVDEDYIDWLNAVQNYKPTSEDFTKLIWTLAPYSKILIFCVFLFIIWAWIKKPFKSKKL